MILDSIVGFLFLPLRGLVALLPKPVLSFLTADIVPLPLKYGS